MSQCLHPPTTGTCSTVTVEVNVDKASLGSKSLRHRQATYTLLLRLAVWVFPDADE